MNIAVKMEGVKLRPSTELMRSVPLLGDLSDVELAQIAGFFTAAMLQPGEILYAEGTPATSACFVVAGELDAFARLPGGGEAMVGTITAGHVIGEMALLNGGLRTASVRARGAAHVLEVSSSFFQASLDRMDLPAHKILRRVIGMLAARLGEVSGRIVATMSNRATAPAPTPDAATDRPTAARPNFDFLPFLPLLPGLCGFQADEIYRLLEFGEAVERPAQDRLYDEGAAADMVWLVLRGAIEFAVQRSGRMQLAVIGPGRLCGANEIITGQPRSFGAATRTGSLLLEFDREAFWALFDGEAPTCLKFQQIVGQSQLRDLKAANNLLALLVNQAQIQNGSLSTEPPLKR